MSICKIGKETKTHYNTINNIELKADCPRSSYYGRWNKFEIELINFVEKHPILYDPLAKKMDIGMSSILDVEMNLWIEFSTKWNYSVKSIRHRWNMIKAIYFRAKREQKESSVAYKKIMDGHLSFLEPVFNSDHNTTVNSSTNTTKKSDKIKIDANASSAKVVKGKRKSVTSRRKKTIPKKFITDDEEFTAYGIVVKKIVTDNEKFSDFELMLIDYVKKFIYDPDVILDDTVTVQRYCLCRYFDHLSLETSMSVSYCMKTWNRLRMEYYRVRKIQDGIQHTQPKSFLKYLDGRFEFLEPSYQLIKEKYIDVLTIEPEQLDEEFEKYLCHWTNFQLRVINFVKKHPIFYRAMSYDSKKQELTMKKQLYEELANTLNTTTERCIKSWNNIKDRYDIFKKKKYQGVFYYSKDSEEQFQLLSFLDKENFSEKTQYYEKVPDSSTTNLMNISDKIIEMVDNKRLSSNESVEMVVSENESEMVAKESDIITVKEDFDNIFNMKFDEDELLKIDSTLCMTEDIDINTFIEYFANCDEKKEISNSTREENDDNVKSIISNQTPTSYKTKTCNLFKEIGEYVTERFSEKKQKEIRHKSIALLTQIELAMLRE